MDLDVTAFVIGGRGHFVLCTLRWPLRQRYSGAISQVILTNSDLLSYFDSVHFLCVTSPPDALRTRMASRDGSRMADVRIDVWLDFNNALVAAASEIPTATVLDAGRPAPNVEADVRHWINSQLHASRAASKAPTR